MKKLLAALGLLGLGGIVVYYSTLANTASGLTFSFLRPTSGGYRNGSLYLRFLFRVSNPSGNSLSLEGFYGDMFALMGKQKTPYKVGDFVLRGVQTDGYVIPAQGSADIAIEGNFVVSDLFFYLKDKGSQLSELAIIETITRGELPLDDLLMKGTAKVDGSTYPLEYTI